MGCCDFCLICHVCSWRCSLIGRVRVSSCICCGIVTVVHPVAILSAVFCVICSLHLMLVVTILWRRARVWVLLWLCMLR